MNTHLSYKNFLNWKFILSFSISIIFSFYAFKRFDLSRFLNILHDINYLYVLSAIVLLIFVVYIRALRWKLLFIGENISVKKLFEAQMVGYFGNNIFPLRLGEGLRCFFLSKRSKIGFPYILCTIILERFLDMLGLILLGVILFFIKSDFINNYNNKYFVSLVFIIVIVMLLFSFYFNSILKHYNSYNRLVAVINDILKGFQSLSFENIFSILSYTILIWSFYILEVYLIQYSISLDLSLSDCILILFISSLVLSIPSAPANIGTFEAGVIYAMSLIGIIALETEFAIILHAATFFPYTILGGILFMFYNYGLFNNNK